MLICRYILVILLYFSKLDNLIELLILTSQGMPPMHLMFVGFMRLTILIDNVKTGCYIMLYNAIYVIDTMTTQRLDPGKG